MTNQEAIKIIQDYKKLDTYMNNTRRLTACDMAIEALQKNMLNEEAVSAIAYTV